MGENNNPTIRQSDSISIRDYVDLRFTEFQKAIDIRFDGVASSVNLALISSDKATLKAEVANEKRFESVTEFRETLTSQASKFVTRDEVKPLQKLADVAEGKASQNAMLFVALASVIGILIGVINLVFMWRGK